MPYLSEIQHRTVIEPNGDEVGKLADVAVVPQGQFPAAQWAILATRNGEKVLRWADLAPEIGHFRLRSRLANTPDQQLPAEALRLARDLLDKQIVDTHGAKVVRVNDLQLSEVEGQLRLVGADVGMRGIFRRIGAERLAERAAGIVGRKLPRGIIPWHLVEPLQSADAAVRLTVPHAKLALLHPADIADIVEEMTADERVAVFEQLDAETAAEALAEVEPEMQAAIVSDLDEELAARPRGRAPGDEADRRDGSPRAQGRGRDPKGGGRVAHREVRPAGAPRRGRAAQAPRHGDRRRRRRAHAPARLEEEVASVDR